MRGGKSRGAGREAAGCSPWRRFQRWCPRPRRTWRGRAGLCRAGLRRRGRAGRTMPRWLCASQWELTRRRRPSYRAGGRRARCPAPRPIGRARRGRRAPIGRGANNGARPLKGAGERRHCSDELRSVSARRAQRGAEPRPSPRYLRPRRLRPAPPAV